MTVEKYAEDGWYFFKCLACGKSHLTRHQAHDCEDACAEAARLALKTEKDTVTKIYELESVPCETNPINVARPSLGEHKLEESVTLPNAEPNPPVMAPELLGRAAAIMHERGKTYDAPEGERSMGKTVAAFNAITGRDMTESEGWLFMAILKAVRGFTRSAYHADSFEDLIAYAALMAEARGAGR